MDRPVVSFPVACMVVVLCPRLFAAMTMNTAVQMDIPVMCLNKSVTKKMESQLLGWKRLKLLVSLRFWKLWSVLTNRPSVKMDRLAVSLQVASGDAALCQRLFAAMTTNIVVLMDIPVMYLNRSATKKTENQLPGPKK
jgi:hypothetical protein